MQELLNYKNDNGSFHLYQYEKNSDELLSQVKLNSQELNKLNSFTSKKRKKEWLAVRYLLKVLHPKENISLVYNEHGKPSLSNQSKISISHSDNYVAIALSASTEIGIDIQYHKDKIKNIQSKFTHPLEIEKLNPKPEALKMEFLHYLWTAKEAIYKTIAVPGTIFTEIDGSQFEIEKNKNWIATYRSEIFTLYSIRIDQLYLSFCHNIQ